MIISISHTHSSKQKRGIMRWFKHYSDNYRGRSVETLYDEMGHVGISCYYLFMEICTEKMERKSDNGEAMVSPRLHFGVKFVQRNLRLTRAKLERWLHLGATLGLFSYEISEKELQIDIPILLELLDSDSKRSRSRRATDASQPRLDIDRDIEGEGDGEREGDRDSIIAKTIFDPSPNATKTRKKKATSSVDPKASALVAHYCENFKTRYSVNPSVSKADSGILKNIFESMGIDRAKDLISAYFEMPDTYVIKAKHPIKLLSYKINEVLVFSETGNFVTNSQARQGDVIAGNMMLLQKMNSAGSQ